MLNVSMMESIDLMNFSNSVVFCLQDELQGDEVNLIHYLKQQRFSEISLTAPKRLIKSSINRAFGAATSVGNSVAINVIIPHCGFA